MPVPLCELGRDMYHWYYKKNRYGCVVGMRVCHRQGVLFTTCRECGGHAHIKGRRFAACCSDPYSRICGKCWYGETASIRRIEAKTELSEILPEVLADLITQYL